MDSSKWVATIDLLPHFAHAYIILLWMLGKSVRLVSIPRSPLATITPQEALLISWILSKPSWFSILAIIFAWDFFLSKIAWSLSRSSEFLTKDKAIKSTLFFIPKFISSRSFVVSEGRFTLTPGRFTWRLEPNLPPSMTLHKSVSSSLDRTLKLIKPLSTDIFEPWLTLWIKSL